MRTKTNPIEYNYGPVSVAIGDFNRDTWIDMVIVNSIVSRIGVYFGNANGTFIKEDEYSTGITSHPKMAAVDNLNNDSYLDIAVANYNTHSIGIFYGFGNGSFRDQIEISTGISQPLSLHLVDFNNDTFIDIIVINYGTNSISIFYGNRDGNFVNRFTYSTGYDSFPYALTTGDLNNDNCLDIVIANFGTNDIHLVFFNSNNTIQQ